jgi:hypothetical protein
LRKGGGSAHWSSTDRHRERAGHAVLNSSKTLVIADLALKRGFITNDVFSTLVFMGMMTTMMTPWLLKKAFERVDAHAAKEAAAAVAAGAAPPAMARRPGKPDVPEELISDLPNRRDWARNASGTETDAGVPRWRREKSGRHSDVEPVMN